MKRRTDQITRLDNDKLHAMVNVKQKTNIQDNIMNITLLTQAGCVWLSTTFFQSVYQLYNISYRTVSKLTVFWLKVYIYFPEKNLF